MSEQQESKAAEEKAPEKTEQQEASAEENEAADKTPEQPPKEMRAVVLTGFGGLKSVKVLKKPEPTLGEGEVLIRVKAWWVKIYFINGRVVLICLYLMYKTRLQYVTHITSIRVEF